MSEQERRNPSEKEIRDLLPSYVLGTLERNEFLLVDDYLATHPELLEQVRSLENTTMQLAFSAPVTAPPMGSKERILGRAKVDAEQTNLIEPISKQSETTPLTMKNGKRASVAPRTASGVTSTSLVPQRSQKPIISASPDHSLRYPQPRPNLLRRFRNWWSSALGWKMYALATTIALAFLYIFFNQGQVALEQSNIAFQAATEEIAVLTSQRNELTTERDDLTSLRNNLTADLNQLSIATNELTEQTVSLQSMNDELTRGNSELQKKTDELDAQYTGLQKINMGLQEENIGLQNDNTQLQEEKDNLQEALTVLENQSRDQSLILALFPSVDPIVTLQGTEPAPNASGSLWTGPEGGYLLITGLEPLSDDQTYQLWLIPDGADPVGSGLITVSSTNSAVLSVVLTLEQDEFSTVGLSIEPAGGSPQPTGDIVLLGSQA